MWNLKPKKLTLSRSARQRAKANNKLSRELAHRAHVGLELLEPRMLLAGMPTLIDLVPGAGSSSPSSFTNVNNFAFFVASDPTNGTEIWKSDGTLAGTVLAKDVRPGNVGSGPTQLLNLNGLLMFTANDGTSGVELWRSNGQVAGTVRVKDIRPGAFISAPTNLVNHNSTLFFSADDGLNGRELGKSTAFGPGTLFVADISANAGSSNPAFIESANTMLFFAASDGSSGSELWTLSNQIAAALFAGLSAPGSSTADSSSSALRDAQPQVSRAIAPRRGVPTEPTHQTIAHRINWRAGSISPLIRFVRGRETLAKPDPRAALTPDCNAGLDFLFASMDDLDGLYGDPLTEEFVAV